MFRELPYGSYLRHENFFRGLNKMVEENKNKKPVLVLKDGTLELSVWNNELVKDGETTSFNTITFVRNYTNKEGVWMKTTSLRQRDLLQLANLLSLAYNKLNVKESFTESFL